MLKSLAIENLALIESLSITFQEGLTVVTGETGAGKSILVQAVAALLGEPVHAETVRSGSTVARVEGVFELPADLKAVPRFNELDLGMEAGSEICLTREMQRGGRNRFLVNDQLVRKNDFQWLGSQLLDINSQHSHQLLLQPRYHLDLLDNALALSDPLQAVQQAWQSWNTASTDLRAMNRSVEEMEKRRQLIEYQMREIDEAGLHSGEKRNLIEERERLRFAGEIRQNLTEALRMLDEDPCRVTDHAARVASLVRRAGSRDSRLESLAAQAEAMVLTARDLSAEIRREASRIHGSPERLNEVSERLFYLQQLEGKFQNDVEGILAYRQDIEIEYREYSSRRSELDNLATEFRKRREAYRAADDQLTAGRRKAAPDLCATIIETLAELGMPNTRFEIAFQPRRDIGESDGNEVPDWCSDKGSDRVEFVFSANPGVPLKPVSQIASGGELSRVMMALKQHLDDSRNHQTMILDEVDSGIGGEVANAVGDRLRVLAGKRQIICITHLPQIAVRGHNHILVEKTTDGIGTQVCVTNLDRAMRIAEIARMLSGEETRDAAMLHADNLLNSIV